MNAVANNAPTVQEFIDNDHTNDTGGSIVVMFVEAVSSPYFLSSGETLPAVVVNAYEIKQVHLA
jgi:hypothetical protein